MRHYNCAGEKGSPIGMVSVIVSINHVFDRAAEALLDKSFDCFGLFRKDQRINEDCTLGCNNYTRSNLRVLITGENKNVIRNTFTLHRFVESTPIVRYLWCKPRQV